MNSSTPDPAPSSRQDFVLWPQDASSAGEGISDELRDTVVKLTGEAPESPETVELPAPVNLPPPPSTWQRSTASGWRDEPRWWEMDFVKEEQQRQSSRVAAAPVPSPMAPPPDSLVPDWAAKTPATPPPPSPAKPAALQLELSAWGGGLSPFSVTTENKPAAPVPPPAAAARSESPPSASPAGTAQRPPIPPSPSLTSVSNKKNEQGVHLEPAAAPRLDPPQLPEEPISTSHPTKRPASFLPPPRKKTPAAEVSSGQEEGEQDDTPGFAEALLLPGASLGVASQKPKPEEAALPTPPVAAVPVVARRPGLPQARRIGETLPPEERVRPHLPVRPYPEQPPPVAHTGNPARWMWWLLFLLLLAGGALAWVFREYWLPAGKEWLLPLTRESPTPAALRAPPKPSAPAMALDDTPNSLLEQPSAAPPSSLSEEIVPRAEPVLDEELEKMRDQGPEGSAAPSETPSLNTYPETDNAAAAFSGPLGSSASTDTALAVINASKRPEADEKAAAAARVVEQVTGAATVEEVVPWILEAENLAPLLKGYYTAQPLQPLKHVEIELMEQGTTVDTRASAFVFNVRHEASAEGFPVLVEETPAGMRLDWQSYIQWRDEWLKKFATQRGTAPQILYVTLRRTHYFNDDVPDLENKLAFRLASARSEEEGVVAFVDRQSGLGRELDAAYRWHQVYFPVVELQWEQEGDNRHYVRLRRVVRASWKRLE